MLQYLPIYYIAAIKRVIEDNALDMEVIVNPKALEGGINVYQLETAVGAAMKCFDNGVGIKVSCKECCTD